MRVKAVYGGSFDPLTKGHINIIERASRIFGEVIVAIGVNSAKKPLFSLEEREEIINMGVSQHGILATRNIQVTPFEGLLIDYCRRIGAQVLVRGLRAATDFDYELGIAQANATQDHDIQTVFLATDPQFSFVSSSVVKELAKYGGHVRDFVDPAVEIRLYEKFGRDKLGQPKT